MKKQKQLWYQVNPHYYEQILLAAGLPVATGNFLQILTADLPRILALGFTGLWLMPVFERGLANRKGFGSPYAVREYKLAGEWGSEGDFLALKEETERLGLLFIGEYIPNHLAPDAKFFEEHPEGHYVDSNGQPYQEHDWTDVIKLKHAEPSVQAFAAETLVYLCKQLGLEGFRADMAHYVFAGPGRGGDIAFWPKVFALAGLDPQELYLLAEVYDDRDSSLGGYADHLRLVEAGFRVYDKRLHDLLARSLYEASELWNLQGLFFDELRAQATVAHLADCNTGLGDWPFVRFASNHDDCPGSKIFGDRKRFLLALATLLALPGDGMFYAGEEFGLAIKPSVVGWERFDSAGQLSESAQIKLLSPDTQTQAELVKILSLISSQPAFSAGVLLQARLMGDDGLLKTGMLGFARFLPHSGECLLFVCNASAEKGKSWAQITDFFPAFSYPHDSCAWNMLKHWLALPEEQELEVQDLITGQKHGTFTDTLWVGLEQYDFQVLRLNPPSS